MSDIVAITAIDQIAVYDGSKCIHEENVEPESTAYIVLQDDGRTLKIFIRGKSENPIRLQPLMFEKVTRLTIVNDGVTFEKYELFQHGCMLDYNGGTLTVHST